MELPRHSDINVTALARLFRNTTNSYKYLFFYALFRRLLNTNLSSLHFTARELVVDGLVIAWYPHVLFRLSFGHQDQIGSVLDKFQGSEHWDVTSLKYSPSDTKRLRNIIDSWIDDSQVAELVRWVPYRLLTPFFTDELKEQKDSVKNQLIVKLSSSLFDSRQPLYQVRGPLKNPSLQVHPSWMAYFHNNQCVIEGWFMWEWLQYMQRRNPNVPGLPGKLFPVLKRKPLKLQRRYWRAVLTATEIHCIYSGTQLGQDAPLDHYVPWSFVLHDRLWNLVPVDLTANSSKNDCLADSQYLLPLARVQAKGLCISRHVLKRHSWDRVVEEYLQDLPLTHKVLYHLSENNLASVLHQAYLTTIPALEQLACNQGFQPGWIFSAS